MICIWIFVFHTFSFLDQQLQAKKSLKQKIKSSVNDLYVIIRTQIKDIIRRATRLYKKLKRIPSRERFFTLPLRVSFPRTKAKGPGETPGLLDLLPGDPGDFGKAAETASVSSISVRFTA